MSVHALLESFAIVSFALAAVVVIVLLRKLFLWRYGESTPLPTKPMGCGTVVLALLLGAGLLTRHIRHGYDTSVEQQAAAKRKPASEPVEAADPEEAEELESPAEAEAQVLAEERLSDARRASLEVRWRKARSIAVEKWRADLLTANAIGEIGAAPPMLVVRETGAQVQIQNRGPQPVCVALARVTRPNTDAVERCQVGPAQCSLVKPGATVRLQTYRAGAKEACLHAAFEYRVGNVDNPEPSWWSRTAINEFADPPQDISYKEQADLQADIARYEATVEDADRAVRWRKALGR